MSRPNKHDQPLTALDRAFGELHAIPAARRVFASTNMIAMAMRTLAAEWEASETRALQLRAAGLIEAARAFESASADLMGEVSR